MFKRALLGFLFFPAFVLAQETAPLIGSEATQPQTEQVVAMPTDGVNRILVIGDAMAGGLGAGMARMAAGDATMQVVSRFNESSGITRPDIYDWASALPKIMEGKNFTSVVVLIGLNDSQGIRGAGGQFAFNTPEWIAAYQANTDLILDSLISQNVKVYWLGEPPMGDATYDAEMKQVAGLQKNRVVAKGATFIDTRPLLLSPDGAYVDLGPDDTGEIRKLRQKDGVTFFKQGNNKFAQLILSAIKNGAPAGAPVAAAASEAVLPSSPVFGQADVNGATVVAELGTVLPETRKIEPAQLGSSIVPAPGSAAEKLFIAGEFAATPMGRFDDFSYEAPSAN
jgi:uncharacterized protein